ncbi:MAG: 2-succinyl-5-enolpyruvyl-6-hydroxy-3-cyclohexene-1-carboxylic-acid synthase, partial [Micrococcales bacterium]|nr:2-succinyl-5-enolpyruvyl-6-hydroxy-3-cyclohexene-1-carboxylic-acid synthase [Micrococcales bacterium]
MSPSVKQAEALVEGLIQGGCRWLVLSPGSRSAPLVFAAAQAEAAGRLKILVRLDERSAGFYALGLTLAQVGPVGLVCTSGTAAANYHPAVLEAAYSGQPLVVVTADRPPELQNVGANQTTNQRGLYGKAVLADHQVQPDHSPEHWRTVARQAVAAALGLRAGRPGPVHINAQLREPLVPDAPWSLNPANPPAAAPGATRTYGIEHKTNQFLPVHLEQGPATLVVAGAGAGSAARNLAQSAGWPLLAEPESGSWGGPNAIAAGRLLLSQPELANRIERLVVYGRPVLTRPVTSLVQRRDLDIIGVHPGGGLPFDQGRAARLLASAVTADRSPTPAGMAWLDQWQRAGQAAWQAIRAYLETQPMSGPLVAAAVAQASVGSALLVGASNALRDLDLVPATGGPVYSLRGLAGIDGTVSAAHGLALGLDQPVTVLLGDLTLLHDAGSLVTGQNEPLPCLRLVVLADHGGAI